MLPTRWVVYNELAKAAVVGDNNERTQQPRDGQSQIGAIYPVKRAAQLAAAVILMFSGVRWHPPPTDKQLAEIFNKFEYLEIDVMQYAWVSTQDEAQCVIAQLNSELATIDSCSRRLLVRNK